MGKTRPAQMAAMYVEWGDRIMEVPTDGGRVIGTVIRVHTHDAGYRTFDVRTPSGVVEWPAHPRRPIAPEKPVWIHVPPGQA